MIPKLTIFATLRSSFVSVAGSLPSTSAAEVGADRDRLQVRVSRREADGGRDRLVEGRVQPAVRAEQGRQRLDVRVQELRVLAPLLDHRDDLVFAADRAEH